MAYNWALSFDTFKGIFTEFSSITQAQFDYWCGMGKQYVDIDYYFSNQPAAEQTRIAQLVVAHLLSLAQRGGNGGVGAVNSASEGSVSVGFQGINNANWWQQTPYGYALWNILKKFTTPMLVSGKTGEWY